MDIGIISARYAKALLRFATDNKEEDRVYEEMGRLADVFQKVGRLQTAMQNPVVTNEQKIDLLLKAAENAGGKATMSTSRFIRLVTVNKRAEFMMFIANAYVALYRKSKHIIKGRLTVPDAVSTAVSQRLRDIVERQTQSRVEFEVCIDKNIEGGFILDYDTYRLDASLKTQLEKLHRALS